MIIPQDLVIYLSRHFNDATPTNFRSIGGGSINSAATFDIGGKTYFMKWNNKDSYPNMFEREARGLDILRAPAVIDVPVVVHQGEFENYTFLILDHISTDTAREDFWTDYAQALGKLHKNTDKLFGLDHDNYMGSLPQKNTPMSEWSEFFITNRLEPQLKLAYDGNSLGRSDNMAFEKLYTRLESLFPKEMPALIHGDLWSGNFMVNSIGEACIFDPATYYGHREVDIAMSRLFGGFSAIFYDAYNEFYPMEKGWESRVDVFNLYPLLIHVNLFGGGYVSSVRQIIRKFA